MPPRRVTGWRTKRRAAAGQKKEKKTMAVKKCAKCDTEFQAPMNALWQVYDGIGSKADIVAVAWEREDGKVFRYDLPIPQRLDPKAAKFVSYVVDRIAKFIVWSAGGWKL